jgi:Ca-activated chloride channel family protein
LQKSRRFPSPPGRGLPHLALAALLAATLPFSASRAQDSQPDTLIVIDMSNSMWGQIEGRAKVEIAREALETLAESLPAGAPTGLMAYGHRRTGDCGDVQLVQPVTPLDRGALARAVAAMKPRGKTPITEALRQAAATLNANDRPARLVLVSDGIETCGGDPCALARELAAGGIDFTAHVIGFDIASRADQAKIACIASATGGQYHNARDAGELAAALKASTVETADVPPGFPVTFTAVEAETGNAVTGSVDWSVVDAGDERLVATLGGNGAKMDLEPGDYLVTATSGARAGGVEVSIGGEGASVVVKLASDVPEASVTPAASGGSASSVLSVAFTGPMEEGDFLRIVTPDGERLETDLWDYTREGSPLTMRLPSEPGSYAVAYVWAKGGDRTIARADIEVGPADLAIDMAAELPAGSMTDVSWRGPDGDGDFLAFVAPGGTADAHGNRYAYTRDGAKLSMQAPGEPGTYEAVYVAGNDNTVMIRKPFKVVEAPATLAMTGEPVAGGHVDVSWTGPGGASDWIGFAPVGAPPSEYLGWATPDAPSVRLTVPASAGAYELRYVLSAADGTKVLTSVPVTVTEPVVRLEAPPEVAAGAELSVVAQGPASTSNWVGFARPGEGPAAYVGGAWNTTDNIADGRISVMAPSEPGSYELRFVIAAGEARVVARVPVTVK